MFVEYDYSALTDQILSLNDYSIEEDIVEEEEIDESNYKSKVLVILAQGSHSYIWI